MSNNYNHQHTTVTDQPCEKAVTIYYDNICIKRRCDCHGVTASLRQVSGAYARLMPKHIREQYAIYGMTSAVAAISHFNDISMYDAQEMIDLIRGFCGRPHNRL